MTVIAVKKYKDKFVVAADTMTVYGDLKKNHIFGSKIQNIGYNVTVALSGYVKHFEALRTFHRDNPLTAKDITEFYDWIHSYYDFISDKIGDDETCGLLFILNKKIFYAGGSEIHEITTDFGLGAGDTIAITAMHLGKTAQEAVQAAIDLNAFCGGGIDFIEVKI